MTFPHQVGAAGTILPRSRAIRARLKPHLDADPELFAALLVHLELARDDYRPETRLGPSRTLKPDGLPADTYFDERARVR